MSFRAQWFSNRQVSSVFTPSLTAEDWISPKEELCVIEKMWPGATPMATSVSEADGKSCPVAWVNSFGKALGFRNYLRPFRRHITGSGLPGTVEPKIPLGRWLRQSREPPLIIPARALRIVGRAHVTQDTGLVSAAVGPRRSEHWQRLPLPSRSARKLILPQASLPAQARSSGAHPQQPPHFPPAVRVKARMF